jgi:peptidoglycan L-alanyl-D-glutamate endopeptidase CwlK
MGYVLGAKSKKLLANLHPDLKKVVERAIKISKVDFTVTCTLRTLAEQKRLVKQGFSRTMKSRHLPHPKDGLARAVDLAPLMNGEVRWDWPPYYPMAAAMKQAAEELDVDIDWGGDWKTFKDGPHWELNWNSYP